MAWCITHHRDTTEEFHCPECTCGNRGPECIAYRCCDVYPDGPLGAERDRLKLDARNAAADLRLERPDLGFVADAFLDEVERLDRQFGV